MNTPQDRYPERLITRYLAHRNTPVPYAELGELHETATKLAEASYSLTIWMHLGDIALDAAQAAAGTNEAPQWVQAAEDHFEHIVATMYRLAPTPSETKPTIAHIMVRTLLKRAEIKNWLLAVQGGPPENNHAAFVRAAEAALPYAAQSDEAQGELTEVMPLIFDLRAGGIGRMALLRESYGYHAGEPKQNWDAGITKRPTAAEFLAPPIRMHTKSQHMRDVAAYNAGNIVTLTARDCRFTELHKIIPACAEELMHPLAPTETAKLNTIAASIEKRIHTLPQHTAFRM